jgi:hypothetical protein
MESAIEKATVEADRKAQRALSKAQKETAAAREEARTPAASLAFLSGRLFQGDEYHVGVAKREMMACHVEAERAERLRPKLAEVQERAAGVAIMVNFFDEASFSSHSPHRRRWRTTIAIRSRRRVRWSARGRTS